MTIDFLGEAILREGLPHPAMKSPQEPGMLARDPSRVVVRTRSIAFIETLSIPYPAFPCAVRDLELAVDASPAFG